MIKQTKYSEILFIKIRCNQNMKILFLTSEGFDTPNSINHLCATLLEDILKAKISVHSISSHKTGIYDDIPDFLLEHNEYTYDVIKRKSIDKNNFVIRYFDEIKYAFKAKKIWKQHKNEYDAVLLQSNPNSVFNSSLLKLFLNKPIILNLYDVFPGHAMSIGVIKSKFVYNVLRFMQRILYHECKYIVAMSDDMKSQLLSEKVKESKVKVINNWFDNSVFKQIPRNNNKFFLKYSLDTSKFYVQFAGLLGYVFDYKMFFDTAEKLKRRDDIVFLLIGDGNQKNIILDEIETRQLNNVKYYPWQPLEIISDVYNACDIGFIPLRKGVIGNGIPSKACQLMAAGKVILNSIEESNYTDLFVKYHMGVNITDYNVQSVANTIENLYDNRDKMQVLGSNAHNYSYEHYSRETNTLKFVELIKEVAANKRL